MAPKRPAPFARALSGRSSRRAALRGLAGAGTAVAGLGAGEAAGQAPQMEAGIAALRGHVVLCGGGDTALEIARELVQTRTPFAVVDRDPDRLRALRALAADAPFVVGDATDTDVLSRAGVEAAWGLVACLPTDKENLFVVIEARDLNPRLRIAARLINEAARPKLARAGADAVVAIGMIGARRITAAMLRPGVHGALDAMVGGPENVRVQELAVGPGAVGKPLAALRLQERAGVVVFGIQEGVTGHSAFNPPPDRVLKAGDVLIACAAPDQLAVARRVATEG